MVDSKLRAQSYWGVLWSSVQKFGVLAISFISNIILARILSPDDFGCIGMLAIFIAIGDIFIDGGFAVALIQKKRPTQEDYSTVFYCNLIISIFLYILLFFTAPAISSFYRIPLLKDVLRVEGLVFIINGFRIIQANQIRKKLKFKELSIIEITSAVITLALTVYFAYLGWGIWALVAQQILHCFITVLLMWIVNKWYPSWVFSKQSFKELFSFGGFVLLSNIITILSSEIQGLLIGLFFNPATMGYYSQARKLESVPAAGVSAVINQVSFPVLSEAQNDNNTLIQMTRRFIVSVAFLIIPIMFLCILIGKQIIVLCYSDKWIDSVPYFQVLCLAGIAVSMNGINYYAVAVKGKSKELLYGTFVKKSIGIALIIGGLVLYGMKGLLIGTVLGAYFSYLVNALQVKKYVGYSIWSQARDIFPLLICSLFAFIVSFISTRFFIIGFWGEGAIRFIVFVTVYMGMATILKLDAYKYIKSIINEIFTSFSHKQRVK